MWLIISDFIVQVFSNKTMPGELYIEPIIHAKRNSGLCHLANY